MEQRHEAHCVESQDGLYKKPCLVLDGHKTAKSIISTYAGVVFRDNVRITFTYAVLNGLDVCVADIQNAYLQAPSSCKDFIICGPEFGFENVERVAPIYRALSLWRNVC